MQTYRGDLVRLCHFLSTIILLTYYKIKFNGNLNICVRGSTEVLRHKYDGLVIKPNHTRVVVTGVNKG